MAFVSAFTPKGLGAPTSLPVTSPRTAPVSTGPSMRFGIDLSKYGEMAKDGPAAQYYVPDPESAKPTYDGPAQPGPNSYQSRQDKYAAMTATGPASAFPGMAPREASTPSAGWKSFSKSMADKVAPTVVKMYREVGDDSFADAMDALRSLARSEPKMTGSPEVCSPSTAADKYVAECLTAQYKMLSNPMGVYSIACTEGASKLQAEESRELSNMASFRAKQVSVAQKFGSYTEARRAGFVLAKGCSYEESLVAKFPTATSAMIRGYSEAKNMCVRYNTSIEYVKECGSEDAIASAYMSNTVDMQYKQNACASGTYDVSCTDGNQAGLADFKRVQALSARFRANQMSAGAKAQAKYDAKLYARNISRCCSYEEDLFNRFPPIAASMRPVLAKY